MDVTPFFRDDERSLSFTLVVEKIIEITSQKTSNGTNKYDVPEKIFLEPLPVLLSDDNDEFNEWNEV